MTPQQLRKMREDRDMTREEFAQWLGGTSSSAVQKWELGINPIPPWVRDKLLSQVSLRLHLDDLRKMIDLATERRIGCEEIISQAVKEYLARHNPTTGE